MKRIICGFLFLFLFASASFAQSADENKNEMLISGLGFAFQGKDFKTVKLALVSEKPDKFASQTGADGQVIQPQTEQQQPQQIKGKIVIGGYDYHLKVTLFEAVTVEADLFSEDAKPATGDSDKENLKKLPVPLGHVSLTLSEPEPGNPVILGSLRLKDEKVTTVSGEFELYLNDITKKMQQNQKDSGNEK